MATRRKKTSEKTANTFAVFNQEAFESALELQMSVMETASRFTQEFSEFAMHRVQANIGDIATFSSAKSPAELLQMQLDHMRKMFEDYTREANRLIGLAGETIGESSQAVRSTFLSDEELKKAS